MDGIQNDNDINDTTERSVEGKAPLKKKLRKILKKKKTK